MEKFSFGKNHKGKVGFRLTGHLTDRIHIHWQREPFSFGWKLNLYLASKFLFLKFHILQVVAVLLGGMSILSGHVSPEQLMTYVLYWEWLIYATWRVTDNVTSLVQSVGASEKVFQLMNLKPGGHFPSKGKFVRLSWGQTWIFSVSNTRKVKWK